MRPSSLTISPASTSSTRRSRSSNLREMATTTSGASTPSTSSTSDPTARTFRSELQGRSYAGGVTKLSATKWLAVAGGCLVLLAGGCSDDDGDDASTTTAASEETTTTIAEAGTEEQALIAAEAASPQAMETLSDDEFLGGLRVACEQLAEPNGPEPAAMLASLRTVLGVSPQDDSSFAEIIVALVAGAEVLCPEQGAALAEAAGR